jgi:hypothetical protein
MTRKANKTEMKRIVKMLNEYFGVDCVQAEVLDGVIASALPNSVAIVDGNMITWYERYEWNEKFNEWFHRNKCYFNCAGLWFENNNAYSISIYR